MLNCCEFFKDIGYICGDIRFDVAYAGNWPFLAVAVDNSFHIYSAEELKLTYVSAPHSDKITHIAADPGYVYTSTKSKLRVTNITTNQYHEINMNEPISNLLGLGSMIVYSHDSVFTGISTYPFRIAMDEVDDQEEYEQELFSIDCGCDITTIMHPNGYRNKFLVALSDSTFQLWNVQSKMQIYGFNGFESVIRQIIQSPSMDIFAFALLDGRVVFHNIRTDETLFEFQHPSPINDMSFRLDGPPQFAVGLENGSLIVWDLNLRQICTNIPLCHSNAITSVCFLKSLNIVITGGIDNAIRQWEFDQKSKDLVRILRSRVGHQVPPVDITFAEVNGITNVVTCSNFATIIATNPAAEMTSTILSTAPLNKRHLTQKIQSIASTDAHRFCSLASQHENGTLVFLWDIENNRFARKAMTAMPKNGPRSMESDQAIPFADFNGERKATSTCLTRCGNFGCVGTSHGTVEVFVTQSCRWKGSIEKSHESPVAFVHVDALNTIICSGGTDGSIFFHNFDDLSFMGAMDIPGPITRMKPHTNSHLLAISCSQGQKLLIIDIISRNIAREFDVPHAECFCFSHDGKFLFVSNRMGDIYLFDMITSILIEKQSNPNSRIIGIAADPRGDMIATIHENSVATRLWYFRPIKITSIQNMNSVTETEQEGLAIFSDQPQLKMRNLLNPPKDPLKFAKTKIVVPFFLQQTTTIGNAINQETEALSNLMKELHDEVAPQTEFVQLMIQESLADVPNFDRSVKNLVEMNYDKINLEISALRIDEEKGIDERLVFIQLLIYALKKRKHFDMIQAIMSSFLNEYGTKILEDNKLKQAVRELKTAQEEAVKFLDTDVSYSQYLVRLINRIQ